jgi:hypothetical protein
MRELAEAAVAAEQVGDWPAAQAAWRELLRRQPGNGDAQLRLGLCAMRLDQFDAAERHLQAAVALYQRRRPDQAEPLTVLAGLYLELARWADAAEAARRALAKQPGGRAEMILAGALMGLGDWRAGLPLYEKRPMRKAPTRAPEWNGEPLAGKRLLVMGEQGFGDEIQMARFVPGLKAMGAGVVLGARAPLMRLFEQLDVEAIVDRQQTQPAPRHDYWVMAMSLPLRLGVTPQTVPAAPYLAAPEAARRQWAGFPGRIGVVWASSPTNWNAARKSMPANLLADLPGAVDLQAPRGDFADTAAIVEQLDLVITVDTAMAHLAGAMGKPCWVLLPRYGVDWRWGLGERTCWYPSVRLYHQPDFGVWPIEAVKRDLAAFAWGDR